MESHFLFDGRKTNPSPYDPIHAVQFDSLPMVDLPLLSSASGASGVSNFQKRFRDFGPYLNCGVKT